MNELFMGAVEEVAKRLRAGNVEVGRFRHMLVLDKQLRQEVEKRERVWLERANEVLCKLLDEIEKRIEGEEVTMGELVKALDVISTKWNLYFGRPTSIVENRTSQLSDEELEAEIIELQRCMIVEESNNTELGRGE